MDRRTFLAGAGAALLLPSVYVDAKPKRPLGDTRLFAQVPDGPGFPEAIVVRNKRVYVSGPAQFGSFVQPEVLVYSLKSGDLIDTIPIEGQNPQAPQAIAGMAFDKAGRLYVLDIQKGIVRINLKTGDQEIYAPVLPTLGMSGPLPNELIFDKAGNAYISDSLQATIWRVPKGGGDPVVWLQAPEFQAPFGPNGMRFGPKGEDLYVAVSIAGDGTGAIYRIPFSDDPNPEDLEVFFPYEAGAGPDGFAFGKSKKLYVALASSNEISVLRPDGTEETRYDSPIQDPDNPGEPIPITNPAAIAFNDQAGTILVTNHAVFAAPPQPFNVFDVVVKDKALPVVEPKIP